MAKKKVTEEELKEQVINEANEADDQPEATKEEKTQENKETDEAFTDSSDKTAEESGDEETVESDKKDKKDQLIEDLKNQYTRTLAEFDNYRKRTEKEKTAMFEVGAKNIIEKILPIVDNFERGLATVPENDKTSPFVDGMDKIYKQLLKQLEDAGVKEIEAMDKEFNPNFHNAVMHVDDENVGENIIVEVFQKGYTYRDTVVRHSMVKVAN